MNQKIRKVSIRRYKGLLTQMMMTLMTTEEVAFRKLITVTLRRLKKRLGKKIIDKFRIKRKKIEN